MVHPSVEGDPFTGLEEEVIDNFILSIGELVQNQVLLEEDLYNSFSYSRSTTFSPTINQVPHKSFKGFPPFEARSGQEPLVKKFKVLESHEWAQMHFKRRTSQKFARTFTKPFIEK